MDQRGLKSGAHPKSISLSLSSGVTMKLSGLRSRS